jgi:ribosomal protein S18 acetylase RimI-like enzyme
MFFIRKFRFPEDYLPVRHLWASMEKGVNVGRSDELEEIAKKISRDPDLFLVAEEKSRIIGSVIGGYDGRRGLLYHLAVARTHRAQGVGARLLNEVELKLRDKGCLKCFLMITLDNVEAELFYQKHGWHHMKYVRPYAKELG